MLRLVDRNKTTGLDVFKRINPRGLCVGYVVGNASSVNKDRLVRVAGGAKTLGEAREIAGMVYNPQVKETVSEKVHADYQASARMKKPKRG